MLLLFSKNEPAAGRRPYRVGYQRLCSTCNPGVDSTLVQIMLGDNYRQQTDLGTEQTGLSTEQTQAVGTK